MIDWFYLAANSLWILGSTAALATFSYASWKASLKDKDAHHSCWIPIPDRSESIWRFVLSWTGCYVRRQLGNYYLDAVGNIVRCTVGKNNSQE